MYNLSCYIWLLHEWNCAPVLPELDAYVPSKWTASAECAWEIGAAEEYVAALAQLDMQSDEPLYLTAALGVPLRVPGGQAGLEANRVRQAQLEQTKVNREGLYHKLQQMRWKNN